MNLDFLKLKYKLYRCDKMELKINEKDYTISIFGQRKDSAELVRKLYADFLFGGYTAEVSNAIHDFKGTPVRLPTLSSDEQLLYGHEGLEYKLLNTDKGDLFHTRVKAFHNVFENFYL